MRLWFSWSVGSGNFRCCLRHARFFLEGSTSARAQGDPLEVSTASIEKDRGLDLRKESPFIHVSRAQTQPFFNFFSTFIYITIRDKGKKEFHPLLDAMPKDNPNPDDKVNIVQTRRTNPIFPNNDSGAPDTSFLDPPTDPRVRDFVAFLEKKGEALRSYFGKRWDDFLATLGIAEDDSEVTALAQEHELELPRLYHLPYSIFLLSPMQLPNGNIGHVVPVVLRANNSRPCFLCWGLEDIERCKQQSMFLTDVQFKPLLQFSLFFDERVGRFTLDPIEDLDIRVCSRTSSFHDASARKWVEVIQLIHGPPGDVLQGAEALRSLRA